MIMNPIITSIAVLAALWVFAPFIVAIAMFILWLVLFGSLMLD
jgi:hypothetical protein